MFYFGQEVTRCLILIFPGQLFDEPHPSGQRDTFGRQITTIDYNERWALIGSGTGFFGIRKDN